MGQQGCPISPTHARKRTSRTRRRAPPRATIFRRPKRADSRLAIVPAALHETGQQRRRALNFASDNAAGAAPANPGRASPRRAAARPPPMAPTPGRSAPSRGSPRSSRPTSRRSSSPPARPPTRWRCRRWRGPGRPCSATRKPTSTTTNAARRSSSPAAPSSSAFPAMPARSRPRRCARRWRAFRAASSNRCQPAALTLSPGHRGRHGLHARRDRRARRNRPCRGRSPSTWTARASPTRSSRSAARRPR